ncbi:MAG: CaiB/BaiF CoA-transferase family protein [Burkholderiaceae bacterium]|jgi:itaconate CoA-transferase|nr:CaiB/BaiF CoA-transferase family protein [Burkholderiaceae bacterium]
MGALDGITVVTLEHAIAAPFCTRQLADLGARVIKVERPGVGDFARAYDQRVRGLASHFVWTNRSKESLTLDLKHAEAPVVLDRLLERADVLVQNLAPGAAARLGLSFEALHPRFPRLVVCDISGYGADGPYRDAKAYDLLIQSESGFLSITGTPDEPSKAGCSIADIAAGMYAYSNILAALIERGRSGKGRNIDVSMLESMVEWMSYPLYYAFDGQPPPARTGAAHATIYPYGPFPAGDGRVVMLGLQNEREWQVFCTKVLQRPELAADPRFDSNARRTAAREALRAIVVEAFAALTAQQVVDRLNEAGIANANMNTMADVWAHPQLKARERWTEVGTSAGSIPALLPPGMSRADGPRMDAVPALGAHTDAILSELGYAQSQIEHLRSEGAL